MHKEAYDYFRRWFTPEKSQSVLEVGAMDVNSTKQGLVLRKLAPKGCKWVGVDLAEGPGVDRVVPAGERMPFSDKSFDWALLSEVLEHDPEPRWTLGECFRVLKNGGGIIATTAAFGRRYHNPPHLQNWWPEGIYVVVTRAGFRLRHLELLDADLRVFGVKG